MLRAAAIGIGSNSLRMLVADVKDAQLHRVLRTERGCALCRIGRKRDIDEAMIVRAAERRRHGETGARAGAQAVHLFATRALRDNAQPRGSQIGFGGDGLRAGCARGDVEASCRSGATGPSAPG
jgi:hypothetical protein